MPEMVDYFRDERGGLPHVLLYECPVPANSETGKYNNNFEIILDHFSRIYQLHPTPHSPCDILLGARADRVLIGVWNPMLCPIWGFRYTDVGGGDEASGQAGNFAEVRVRVNCPKTHPKPKICGLFRVYLQLPA